MKEAMFYSHQTDGRIQCHLCPHGCQIKPGGRGICRVRVHQNGRLETTNFAQVSACALDPVEKKPLYHFHPGKTIYSLGTFGCNLSCQFCQNWGISQGDPPVRTLLPPDAVATAQLHARDGDCIGLAYTYSEPVVWYEYVLETAKLAREAGLKNVMVTNGMIQPEPLGMLLPWLDAMNIDLKAFSSDFYREICGGYLEPVKDAIRLAAASCHLELTVLLIPGLNDGDAEIRALSSWIAEIDPLIPVHFSRYFPQYKMTRPPTSIATLQKARDIAKEVLSFVYVGNVPQMAESNTICPRCGHLLVRRDRGFVELGLAADGTCPQCGYDGL